MKIFASFLIFCSLSLFTSCNNAKNVAQYKEPIKVLYEPCNSAGIVVIGKVVDEYGEPIISANVIAYDAVGQMIAGASTNLEGDFRLEFKYAVPFQIEIQFTGLRSEVFPKQGTINAKPGTQVSFSKYFVLKQEEIRLEKPMIYLYSDDTINADVQILGELELVNCYPEYSTGWQVQVIPGGKLRDAKGREFYGLYWEAEMPNFPINQDGFVVKKEDNIMFLEKSLATLGLTDREANEFIVYWLPILNKAPYNFIHFSTEEYNKFVPLDIHPIPDQLIRIMMFYRPLNEPIESNVQKLIPIHRENKGFTVVEWGGSMLPILPN